MRLCSSTQPISMTRLPSLGLRPVVSVSRTIWRMGQSQWFGVAAAQYSKRRADAQSLPLTESTPRLASTSARSLPGWPLWPRTQRQSTWWTAWAASIACHRSTFLTGSLAAVFQPRACQYVQKGISEWIHGWKARGWKTAAKEPVKNVDLWQALDAAQAVHQVDWRWVRGHNGHPGNERADVLANRGVDSVKGKL